jgi:hypothetical protein
MSIFCFVPYMTSSWMESCNILKWGTVPYFPFQSDIFTAIDITQSARANHELVSKCPATVKFKKIHKQAIFSYGLESFGLYSILYNFFVWLPWICRRFCSSFPSLSCRRVSASSAWDTDRPRAPFCQRIEINYRKQTKNLTVWINVTC